MKNNLEEDIILRISDNATFAKVEDNIDYQQYLQWLAEGNEPEIIDLSNDII
jgi:hypothetical protein